MPDSVFHHGYRGPERRRPYTRLAKVSFFFRRWVLVIGALFGFIAVYQIYTQQQDDRLNRVVSGNRNCGFYRDVIDYINQNPGAPPPLRMKARLVSCEKSLVKYRLEAGLAPDGSQDPPTP